MRRRGATHAEVAGRAHEAAPEVIVPNAVGHYARGQRIRRISHPLRELQSAAALGLFGQLLAAENLQETAPHQRAGVLGIALQVDLHIRRWAINNREGDLRIRKGLSHGRALGADFLQLSPNRAARDFAGHHLALE